MSTHKANTLNITYKQCYAQVVDMFGDTWTRTKNRNGNWVWALGDYEENAPIYGAQQTGTLPTALEPYSLELITWKRQEERLNAQIRANSNEANRIITQCKQDQEYFNEAVAGFQKNDPVSPNHYKGFSNGSEVIDITENLSFNTGSAIERITNAGRADGNNKDNAIEDLREAIWHLEREIHRLSNA